jgi:hypothetical protein
LGRVQYNPDLFTKEVIRALIVDFRRMLENLIQNPRQSISDLCRDFVSISAGASI